MPRYIYAKAISANPLASYTPPVKGRYRFSAHSDANRYTFAESENTSPLINEAVEFNTMHSETFSESMDMFARDERERVGVATVNPFGNGSNGSVVISEDSVITGGDLHCYNLTIKQGKKLYTNGYRIFVQNQLTFGNSSMISTNQLPENGLPYPDPLVSRMAGGPQFLLHNAGYFPKREYVTGNDGSAGRAIIVQGQWNSPYSYSILGGRGAHGSFGGNGDYVDSGWAGIGRYEMKWKLISFKDRDISSNFATIRRGIDAGGNGGPGYGGNGSPTRSTFGGGGGAGAPGGGFIFISANKIKFPSASSGLFSVFNASGLQATVGYASKSPNYYGGRGGCGGGGGGGVVIINFNSFTFPSPGSNVHKGIVNICGGSSTFEPDRSQYLPGTQWFRGNLPEYSPWGGRAGENGSFIFRCISTGRYYSGTRVPGGQNKGFIDFPPNMSYFS